MPGVAVAGPTGEAAVVAGPIDEVAEAVAKLRHEMLVEPMREVRVRSVHLRESVREVVTHPVHCRDARSVAVRLVRSVHRRDALNVAVVRFVHSVHRGDAATDNVVVAPPAALHH
jgi:hypothetical protein